MRSEILYTIIGVPTLLIIGGCEIAADIRRVMKRSDFTQEYLNRFDKTAVTLLHNKRNIDQATVDDVTWLVENVEPIQIELGSRGIMAAYRPPYSSVYYENYHLLLNTLSDMKLGQAHQHQVGFCIDALIKHRGALKSTHQSLIDDLRNPLAWLRRGVQFAVSFPFRMLAWSGLLKQKTFFSIRESGLVKVVSALVTIFGIVGTVFSIVSGWDSTINFLQRTFHIRHHQATVNVPARSGGQSSSVAPPQPPKK